MPVSPYVMALCRPVPEVVFGEDNTVQADVMDRNLARYEQLIGRTAGEHGARLIAFPQFGLSGYKMMGYGGWLAGALDVEGPQVGRLAAAARAADAYVVVQTAERPRQIPDRYFLSAVVLTPQGKVGMVYRKNYTLSLRTSPVDVYDRYIAAFGPDSFYPVLDTPLGRIGVVIGAEPHWPEAVRSLALNGAEVVINPIAAAQLLDYMKRGGAEWTRPVRAFENMVVFGMTNVSTPGAPAPQAFDHYGEPLALDVHDGFTLATVDVEALREARRRNAANFLAQLQPSLHKPLQGLPAWPANAHADGLPDNAARLYEMETEAWARLQATWAAQF
jgi:predicted amidohydrolase